jgi:XTP/dITP diphosphohydrolase
MKSLVFVTSNPQKLKEAREILGIQIISKNLEIDEIQELNIEKVIKRKALDSFERMNTPLFVDDVGLFIDEWNGFPGPFIKHVGGNKMILKMMRSLKNRKATVKLAIGYHDGKKVNIFTSEVYGTIAKSERGEGMGWDPIFIPNGYTKTWAELGSEIKNNHSHRKIALDKLNDFLNQAKKVV